MIARYQTPNLVFGSMAIFAGFAIAVAWSGAATPKIDVADCDSAATAGAILPSGGVHLLGTTLYKQPKRCSQYRALQMSTD